jgi:hypothetical protein
MIIRCLLFLIIFVLGACGSEMPREAVGQVPPDYKQIIVAAVRKHFYDPFSIRDAKVSSIFKGFNAMAYPRWSVCIEANAKSRVGGYTGLDFHLIQFLDGKLVLFTENWAQTWQCKDRDYTPFPDINWGG